MKSWTRDCTSNQMSAETTKGTLAGHPLSKRYCARTAHSAIITNRQKSAPIDTFPQVKRTSTSVIAFGRQA